MSGARRVLFLHSSAGRYGADRQLQLLASSLDRSRWEPLAVLPFEGPLSADLRAAGVEVFTGPLAVLRREHMTVAGAGRLLQAMSLQAHGLERLVRAHRIDVVHANTSVILGARKPAHDAGARLVVHVREIYPRTPVAWPVQQRSILSADAVVCVSEATRAALGGGTVVHDGLAVVPGRAPREVARLALGLPRHPVVVAVLGRISGWKGQDLLARALGHPELVTRGVVGLIAGDVWPGQERWEERLRSLASQLGVTDRLVMAGFRDDVDTVYGAADVVAVPSTQPDPLPNSALEAAAAGCCVVAANHGGLPEIVRDGETGALFEANDADSLARTIARLADDRAMRERMGEAAALDVRRRFAPALLTERMTAIYDAL